MRPQRAAFKVDLTMVVGIAAALIVMRRLFGIEMQVKCRGDVCLVD
jgi:hypothetical protein